MRRLVRIVAVAGVVVIGASGVLDDAARAHASPDSIVRFALPTFLQGADPSQLVIRFAPVVDLGSGPEHATGVSGTLTFTSGGVSVTQELTSDGPTADTSIDLSQLPPGEPTVSGSIGAAGADVPYTFDGYRGPTLVAGGTGGTVPAGLAEAEAHRDLWGCDAVEYHDTRSTCIVSSPRSGDETWQRGFRLAFHWTPYVAEPDPDATCLIQPMLPLLPDGSQRTPVMAIQVPGDWASYSVPMTKDDLAGWTPGLSQMSWYLSCIDLYRPFSQTGAQSASDLVPDLPPTAPTTVTASPDSADLAVSAGGSTVLGAAALQGYDVTVLSEDGAAVAEQRLSASSRDAARGMRAMVAHPVRYVFTGLRPGRYRVEVAAFNTVGASDPAVSSTVTIASPAPLSAARSAAAKRRGTAAVVTWRAPAKTGGGLRGYTVTLLRGGKAAHSVRVGAATHRLRLSGLKRHVAYRVAIVATTRDGRVSRTTVKVSG